MSKRSRSLPLALNHNSRLNNSVARCRARRCKYKRPNAQKHGIFGTPVIIPGEDRREFQELLAELIDESNHQVQLYDMLAIALQIPYGVCVARKNDPPHDTWKCTESRTRGVAATGQL